MPKVMGPGDKLEIPIRLYPPPVEGKYNLIIQLIQEDVKWFGDIKYIDVEVNK